MARESLHKLKSLVEQLEDRDVGLKRDASLFESVFQDFPVPVAIWLADEKGRCTSRRVSGRDSKGWSNISKDMEDVLNTYQCPELRKTLDINFKKALSGEQISFLCNFDSSFIWTRLTPRFEGGKCVGVIGISWDITANYNMYSTLKRVSEIPAADPNAIEELKSTALKAANSSIISALLEEVSR